MKLTIFFPLAAFLSLTIADPLVDASPCLVRCPYLHVLFGLRRLTTFSYCEQNRCLSEASAVAGCISSIDYKCTCPSKPFKDTLGTCLEVSCTPDDLTGILSSSVPISNQSHTKFEFFLKTCANCFPLAAGELHKERCGEDPPQ